MDTSGQDTHAGGKRRRGRPRTRGITTQMNVRVERELKVRGDEIMRSLGTNPTDVIARLWGYVARTGTIPPFLTDEELERQGKERDRLVRAADEMRGMPWRRLYEEAVLGEEGARYESLADVRAVSASMEAFRAREVAQS